MLSGASHRSRRPPRSRPASRSGFWARSWPARSWRPCSTGRARHQPDLRSGHRTRVNKPKRPIPSGPDERPRGGLGERRPLPAGHAARCAREPAVLRLASIAAILTWVPGRDAPVIARLRVAGAIFWSRRDDPFRQQRSDDHEKPLESGHTPGGSSSGRGLPWPTGCALPLWERRRGVAPEALPQYTGSSASGNLRQVSTEGVYPTPGVSTTWGSIAARWPMQRYSGHASVTTSPAVRTDAGAAPPLPPQVPPRRTAPGVHPRVFRGRDIPEVLENIVAVREQLLKAGAEIVEITFLLSFAFVGPCWSIIKQRSSTPITAISSRPTGMTIPEAQGPSREGLPFPAMSTGNTSASGCFSSGDERTMADSMQSSCPSAATTAPRGLSLTGRASLTSPGRLGISGHVPPDRPRRPAGSAFAVQIAAQPYREAALLPRHLV